MEARLDREERLWKLFHRLEIADIEKLFTALDTKSRTTVFRCLKRIGYFSSYSHAGRYYTLCGIPAFDHVGLWHVQGASFSKHGSLKETVIQVVHNSKAGMTHRELENILRVRVHNILRELVVAGLIGRTNTGKNYLYISGDAENASTQITLKQAKVTDERLRCPLNPFKTIEVLVDLLHSEDWHLKSVVDRLETRHIKVSAHQVTEVFSRYSIKKRSPYD